MAELPLDDAHRPRRQAPLLPREIYAPFEPEGATLEAARRVEDQMVKRRSVRDFAERDVPREVIESLVRSASSAPSGANKQPWTFVAVRDPALKRRIREAAEEEERAFYTDRASDRWLDDVTPLGVHASKPFLETAPWIVVLFKHVRGAGHEQVYYVNESVGIAAGFFIAAVHQAGLVTLTHTPSPMKFLADLLGRPKHEKAFLLLPVGYPAEGCTVPTLTKKDLADVLVVHDLPGPDAGA